MCAEVLRFSVGKVEERTRGCYHPKSDDVSTFDSLETSPSALATRGPIAPTLNPGDLLGGRYRIAHLLGAGGMGLIHDAIDTRTGANVAVKVIHATSAHDAHARARFSREVAALSRVGGEHVAQALDSDVLEDGTPYLVMELLDGRDLRRECRLRGALPVGEAVRYAVQACRGVAHIHQSGIVHRDLKPHNLFVTNLDGARKIKILDFGIAKSIDADPSLTTTSVAVGTPLYMAPELLRNPRELSPLTDVWSLGVILYEMLAGFSPFADAPAPAVLLAVLEDAAVPLMRLRADVPSALDAVIQRALAKDPTQRWPSAELFARALLEFASPEPLVVSAEHRAMRAPEYAALPDPGQLRRQYRAELERSRQLRTGYPLVGAVAALPPSRTAAAPVWDDRSASAQASFVLPVLGAGARSRAKTALAFLGSGVLVAAILLATVWKGAGPAASDPAPSSQPEAVAGARGPEIDAAMDARVPAVASAHRAAERTPHEPTTGTPTPNERTTAMPTPNERTTVTPTRKQGSKAVRPRTRSTPLAPKSNARRGPSRQQHHDDNPLHL